VVRPLPDEGPELVTGKCISARRFGEMMELLKRLPMSASSDPDAEATGYAVPFCGHWSYTQ
jgi:hypothetical protein